MEASAPSIIFVDQSGQLGGAELMLLDVAKSLKDQCEVVLLQTGPFAAELSDAGVSHAIISLGPAARIGKRSGLLSVLGCLADIASVTCRLAKRLRHAEVVCANTPKALAVSALAAAVTRKPLVYWLHDILSLEHFGPNNLKVLVFLTRTFVVRVIANSQATAEAFVKVGGRADSISVLPNGFILEDFPSYCGEFNLNLRLKLAIGEAPVAVMVGRFSPWKGQDVFIRALARVDGLHGILVGDALFTHEDAEFGQSLPVLARELNCEHRIHFVGFRRDVPKILASCQMLVHASTQPEPFGRVIVEGMLSGLPVIAADGGGVREIIEDDINGILVPSGDEVALGEAMRRLLDDPLLAARLGQSGQQTSRDKYGLEGVVSRIGKILKLSACTSLVSASLIIASQIYASTCPRPRLSNSNGWSRACRGIHGAQTS